MTTTTTLREETGNSVATAYRTCTTCGRTNSVSDAALCCLNCGTDAVATTMRAGVAVPLPPQMRSRAVAEDVAEVVSQASVVVADEVKIGETVLTKALVCDACGSANRSEFSFCPTCGVNDRFTRRTVLAESPRTTQATPTQWFGALGVALSEEWARMMRSEKRASGINAALSFVVPGVGQMFAGQMAKGIVLLLLIQLLVHNLGWSPFGVTLLVLRVLFALDAYRIGEKRRRGRKVHDWEWNFRI